MVALYKRLDRSVASGDCDKDGTDCIEFWYITLLSPNPRISAKLIHSTDSDSFM